MENFSFFSNNIIGGVIITFAYRHRKQIIIATIIVILLFGGGIFTVYKINKKSKNKKEIVVENKSILKKKSNDKKKEQEEYETYKVDIKGEINNPGIYSLKINSRVIDVIEIAGGLTENADTSVINLSKKITDEMVIIIYSKEQVNNFEKTKEIENLKQEKCLQKDENSLINGACINQKEKITGKISINTASKEELMTLPGIGESKAKDIITYREQNGPFTNIEDLTKIPGIGENILAQIKEDITL